MSGKKGSENTRALSSHTTKAIEPTRRDPEDLAARLRT
jgi:hypothetical protein